MQSPACCRCHHQQPPLLLLLLRLLVRLLALAVCVLLAAWPRGSPVASPCHAHQEPAQAHIPQHKGVHGTQDFWTRRKDTKCCFNKPKSTGAALQTTVGSYRGILHTAALPALQATATACCNRQHALLQAYCRQHVRNHQRVCLALPLHEHGVGSHNTIPPVLNCTLTGIDRLAAALLLPGLLPLGKVQLVLSVLLLLLNSCCSRPALLLPLRAALRRLFQ